MITDLIHRNITTVSMITGPIINKFVPLHSSDETIHFL
uniref:Uncharacterized protein n=1 Tax=Anguilla anguilla TaxID=7936 RepID=A0A0E9QVP5_ANGAN